PFGPGSDALKNFQPLACFRSVASVVFASASRIYPRNFSKSATFVELTGSTSIPAGALNERSGAFAGGGGAGHVTVPGTCAAGAGDAAGAAAGCDCCAVRATVSKAIAIATEP